MLDTPETPIIPAKATPVVNMKPGVKFTRNNGNKKADGTPLIQEFGMDYTDDVCPKNAAHNVNKIIGKQNGHKLVKCCFCYSTIFESKETA